MMLRARHSAIQSLKLAQWYGSPLPRQSLKRAHWTDNQLPSKLSTPGQQHHCLSSFSKNSLQHQREQEGLVRPKDSLPSAVITENQSPYYVAGRTKQQKRSAANNHKKKLQDESRRNNQNFKQLQNLQQSAAKRWDELQGLPVGNFEVQEWKDSQQVMEFWCRLSKNNHKSKNQNYGHQNKEPDLPKIPVKDQAQNIRYSLQMLNRLLQERQILEDIHSKNSQQTLPPPQVKSLSKVILLKSQWLDKITRNWQQLEKRLAQKDKQPQKQSSSAATATDNQESNDDGLLLLDHKEFLYQLEALAEESNGLLQLNSRIYAMILDVASRKMVRNHFMDFQKQRQKQQQSKDDNSSGPAAIVPTPQMIDNVEYLESIVLHRMLEHNVLPDRVNFSTVLQSWENIGDGNRAKQCLQQMCDYYNKNREKRNSTSLRPTKDCFQSVLNAFARGPKSPQTIDQCREVMKLMQEYHDTATEGHLEAIPIRAYNALLTCVLHNPFVEDAVAQAEQIFREEIPAHIRDKITYNILLEMYSKRGMAQEATNLLKEMYDEYQATNDQRLAPYTKSFNLVLSALNKAGDFGGVEEQFRLMEELHASGTLPNDMAPDRFTYSIVLESWAQQVGKVSDACERCDHILYTMKRLADAGNESIRPTTVTYSIVMKAFANVGDSQRAEELLKEMMDDYIQGKNPYACPDSACFNMVLLALSRSKKNDAEYRIRSLVTLMEEISAEGILGHNVRLRPNMKFVE